MDELFENSCLSFPQRPHLLPLHPLQKETSGNEEETLKGGSANVGSFLQELAQEMQDEKRNGDGMVFLVSSNISCIPIILQFTSSS